jgi:hypothetical protein
MRCLTVFSSLLLIGSLSAAFGQQGQGAPRQRMSVEERVAELKTQLGLSTDQVPKITAVMQAQRDTMQAIRDRYGDDRDGTRAEMGKLRASTDKAISALLTDTQRKKYEEAMAQRQQERGGHGQGGEQGKPARDSTKAQTDPKGK